MKRIGNIWLRVTSWPNLLLAARKAKRGKRARPVVQRFQFRAEWELLELQQQLLDGTYRPGPFTTHTITRPKTRLISAAPYRDRVLHHALMNVLEPIFDRTFHPHSFACRKGKGTHAAADRLQRLMRTYRYAISCDVRQFFPSIDHDILKQSMRRKLKDHKVLDLIDLLIDGSNEQSPVLEYFPGDDLFTPAERRRGLPIGNLTSQWFANLYLDGLDHFVTSRLGFGAYVRYCDDFVVLGNDKAALRAAFASIVEFTNGLRLKLHEDRAQVRAVRQGITFVGFRIWPTHRYLTKDNLRKFRRRLRWMERECLAGRLPYEDVLRRVQSWVGHAINANSDSQLLKTWDRLRLLKKKAKIFLAQNQSQEEKKDKE